MKLSPAKSRQRRLHGETLESRRVLTCFVDNFTDVPGVGTTLRECVDAANAGGDPVIQFASGTHTITLDADKGSIDIGDDIIIMDMPPAPPLGRAAPQITIDGGGATRIFTIDDGSSGTMIHVTLEGLNLVNGNGTNGTTPDADDGYGGAILNRKNLTLTESSIKNSSASLQGGGLFQDAGSLTLEKSTLSGNSSGGKGGGISSKGQVGPCVSTTLIDSTLYNNSAQGDGGGISSENDDLTVFQSTVSGNSSGANGGGIALASDPAASVMAILDRATIAGNDTAIHGGGLYGDLDTATSISNSILSGNIAVAASDLDGEYSMGNVFMPIVDHALVEVDRTGQLVNGANGNVIGYSAMLDPLADNGGLTLTHALISGSPAIDAAQQGVGGGQNDQRGFGPRDVNGRMDMGSYEYGATLRVDPDFDDNGTADCKDVNLLTALIAAGFNDPRYDLNSDAVVDQNDLVAWLAQAGARPEHMAATSGNPFLPSDANLDGVVDGLDFVSWNNFKFTTNANFCDGDFNADGNIDGQDFLIWNGHKFQTSARPSEPAVRQIDPVDAAVVAWSAGPAPISNATGGWAWRAVESRPLATADPTARDESVADEDVTRLVFDLRIG
ncbi:MAG: choice-of-anchor Q domain-containing protein [Planctomycetota bacterium]